MAFLIDSAARDTALNRYALPESLHIPVAACNLAAIETYIGTVARVLSSRNRVNAVLIAAKAPEPPDPLLPIWQLPDAAILHQSLQVWVHVAYSGYRRAYRKAFPDENIDGLILSHCKNRVTAAERGYAYVRVVPISRTTNSSSGATEYWGSGRLGLVENLPNIWANRPDSTQIRYADLIDLMVMLDRAPGGGNMMNANDDQYLVRRPAKA